MPASSPSEPSLDILAYHSVPDWLHAFGSARALGAVFPRHYTHLGRIRRGASRLTAELAAELSAAVHHSVHEARYLALLAELEPASGEHTELAHWLQDPRLAVPPEGARVVRRLLRRESSELHADLEFLAGLLELNESSRANLRALGRREHLLYSLEVARSRELGRRRALDPSTLAVPRAPVSRASGPVDDHLQDIALLRRAITSIASDPAVGLRSYFLGLQQGANAEVVGRLEALLSELEAEFTGRGCPGAPHRLQLAMVTQTERFPSGAWPPCAVEARSGAINLADHAELHHTDLLRRLWPVLEEEARASRSDIARVYAGQPAPLTAIVAFLLGVPLGDPRIEKVRTRFSRIRSGARDEALRREEAQALQRALDLDPALFELMMLRDASEGGARPQLEEAVAREVVRLRARALMPGPEDVWLTTLIYELLQCSGSAVDPAWVARTLRAPVHPTHVTACLDRMAERRLLRPGPPPTIASHGLAMLRLAEVEGAYLRSHLAELDAVERAVEARAPGTVVRSLALQLSPEAFWVARRRLSEALSDLQACAEPARGAWDRVCQITLFLSPDDLG